MGGGFLIGAGRTDKNELPDPSAEQTEVPFDILRGIGDPVHDNVEMGRSEQVGQAGLVAVHITRQQVSAPGFGIFS